MHHNIKRVLVIGVSLVAIMALTASAAWAAQGQITEVNPSGIGKALQASDGRVGAGLTQSQAGALLFSTSNDGTIAP